MTDPTPPEALIAELETLLAAGREQQARLRRLLTEVVDRIEAADRSG